ncbi:DUF2911 domain-containing protein [Chryseolinea sp. H1M3-3]|uniref:DUF2911 domain-containing protein n=1 Tax=Chryseolinea sp. H1M3-3 TaxID=3034144 RepID=UPI0023EC7891|nr:DUF2911 domain-containing protein [Chryseolinea sp. H1M3-3]
MKKKIFIILGILLVGYIAYFLYGMFTTRSHSPSETKTISHQGLDVRVVYCRPYKKNRLIFGEAKDEALVPYDKYWRLGANEATEITFNKNVNFGGKPVQAGSYRMYAVPHADSWQISLNSELGKFGYFEPNYALDVLKVEVPVVPSPNEIEQLTISFEPDSSGISMDIAWDKTLVRVPIATE